MPENNIEKPQQPKKSTRWVNLGILFSGAAVIVLMITFALAGNRLFMILQRLTGLQNQTQEVATKTQQSIMSVQQTIQQNNDELKSQADKLNQLVQTQNTNKNDFQISEAQYLVKLANDNLQYENNIPQAIKLLQAADQQLSTLTDANVQNLRKSLADDIAQLQAVPQVDVTGLYLRLNALSAQLDKLPLINIRNGDSCPATTNSQDAKATWWQRGLNVSWQTLKQLVIVRKVSRTTPPFVTPDQQVFINQNLHAQFEKAEWALLHRKPEIYRASLLQASEWIKKYAQQNNQVTQQLLTNLQELQQTDLHAVTPDVLTSVQAFQAYFAGNR